MFSIEPSLESASFALRTGIARGSLAFSVIFSCYNPSILAETPVGGAAGNEGLGMFSICFDWNYVGSGGSSIGALFTPLSTQMSLYAGTAICMCVLVVHLTL
jgi:hypothetical protein